ncbi:glycoside hydrolase family 9 protein [Pseudochryseolinea flava]|uniref:LacI family transcriptional regulator n=1 Tax=Pseudochryseolinea flava TaxID=2059302 RepID=A0A364XXQ9_9BACT|nr:glycoside hydrolase family 9 protein [Pseudochryseolinea flava]RAV99238.1 LacI family transcriptional regulator [Pseudochryseolinea flava]
MRKIILLLLILSFQVDIDAQTTTKYICVDQFGYRTISKKVAVIRDPVVGFDSDESFTPGSSYAVVDATTDENVLTGTIASWNSGNTDASSGDKVWWFDFSSLETPGDYYILDIEQNLRSYEFKIADDLYQELLKHAVRTFFYQRAGFKKDATYAGAAWADEASHLKNLQDPNARVYNQQNNASTERDLRGGWYDAGDYNKYTTWTANYVVDFMLAYLENPGAWSDDYNIPESGNNIPDLLDEAKWGVDHLVRMQNTNGSVLSIVGLSHASPPSSATGQSLYGNASTSATLNTAAAFAIASKVYGSRGMKNYAADLKARAIKAWDWATANPNVIFKNNDTASGTSGLGAGQQETNDYGRFMAKLEAAMYLFEITGEAKYKQFFEDNYDEVHLIAWNFAFPFETANQEILLHYTTIPNVSANVVTAIKTAYKNAMNSDNNFAAYTNMTDPYRAFIKDYTWGSNATKGSQSLMFLDWKRYNIDDTKNDIALAAAEEFIHYLHGVNPLNFVYLSNMYAYGAENGVNEFYHTWFGNGSAKWDRVGVSTYGPAPGFVVGGPNPSYDKDVCCANNTCSTTACNAESVVPPKNQPAQKSYKDFNTSWPLNSWSVTENSNGYQMNYIRMLSHFVVANYDCSGKANGTATYDVCNICSGGDTGVTPITDAALCTEIVTSIDEDNETDFVVFPNPTNGMIDIMNLRKENVQIELRNNVGMAIENKISNEKTISLNLAHYAAGYYVVLIHRNNTVVARKVVKN